MRVRCVGLAAVLVLWSVAWAAAQSATVNPSRVSFVVSADHNTRVSGVDAVTRYELRVFAAGAAAPLTSSDLGKPAAANGSTLEFDRAAVFAAVPVGEYQVRIAAVGPGGEGVSDPAVPFARLSAPGVPGSVALWR